MTKLTAGNAIIPFSTKDINDNVINTADYKGQKTHLVFFRKASCPFCNMQLRALINQHDEFVKNGIQIIALFGSSKSEILKHAGKQQAPFPIIADGDYKIYKQYGIDISFKGMLGTMFNPKKVLQAMTGGFFSLKSTFQDPVLPANFLLNEDQQIVKAHYGKTYDDHIPATEVLEILSAQSIELEAA
jgi:peroxiredoxin